MHRRRNVLVERIRILEHAIEEVAVLERPDHIRERLDRPVSVAHNRYTTSDRQLKDEKYVTFTKLDAEGKPLWIRDARKNLVMQYITPPVPNNAADPTAGTIDQAGAGNIDYAGVEVLPINSNTAGSGYIPARLIGRRARPGARTARRNVRDG